MDISFLRERPAASSLTVTELNNHIKNLVDSDRTLSAVTVTGEISNLTDHRSGHMYFTLKDNDAQIKAVMFRSSRQRLKFMPEDGMKVTVHGSVSVYTQGGSVQLYANNMTPDGVGALYKAYEQLKEKLSAEGMFSPEHKKDIPRYPEKIGVITSPTGAAVRDIINVTGRRFPLAKIYLYPALVQGEGSEASLIKALDYLDSSGLVDVIIIGRGGGSIEDLWSFNSEALARRIHLAKTPIISAVGHETDFTICDFVADMRAPTPSAAAEISVPDIKDIMLSLDEAALRIEKSLKNTVNSKRSELELISRSPVLCDTRAMFADRYTEVSDYSRRMRVAISSFVSEKRSSLAILSGKADALSPLSVLSRGYGIVEMGGRSVTNAKSLSVGDEVKISLSKGSASATITEIYEVKE